MASEATVSPGVSDPCVGVDPVVVEGTGVSGPAPSFISAPPALRESPDLPGLSIEAQQVLDAGDTTGDYTGERVRARNPALYRVVGELVARGLTLLEVAQITGLARNTVRAIVRTCASGIDQRKQRLAKSFLDLAEVAAASALQRVEAGEQVSLHHLMIAAGIAADKGLLTAGEATARVEHVQDVPERDELLRMLSDRARPAEVLDTGTGARAEEQKGPAAGGGGPAADGPAGLPGPAPRVQEAQS
jgi:hypothetical protein